MRCGQQYVGKAGQPLHCRIIGHRFNSTHGKTDESIVVKHLNGEGHTLADVTVMAIIKYIATTHVLANYEKEGAPGP